jgi:hypothetical protein
VGVAGAQKPKWGLIDYQGKPVVYPKYDTLVYHPVFRAWLAAQNGLWGAVDSNAFELFPPEFASLEPISPTLLLARRLGKWGTIDRQGRTLQPFDQTDKPSTHPPVTELQPYTLNGRWGYADPLTGADSIPPRFSDAYPFRQGRARVHCDTAWGVLNTRGQFVVPCTLRWVNDYVEGHAVACERNRWGLLGLDGNWVISPRFGALSDVQNGWCVFLSKGKYGYIQQNGRVQIEAMFEAALPFSDGIAGVKYQGLWGVLSTESAWVVEPAFTHVLPSAYQRMPVCQKGRWGVITPTGAWVVQPTYLAIQPYQGRFAAVLQVPPVKTR